MRSSSMLLLLVCCVGLCGMGSTNRWMASAAEAGKQYTLQQVAAEGMGEGGPKFSIDRIKQALAEGYDIDGQEQPSGQTLLMSASLGGQAEVVDFLLSQGADPGIGEMQGYTPMHGAGFQGRSEVARVLLKHDIPAHDVHPDGFSPLHRAAWGRDDKHRATIRVLVEEGKEDVDVTSPRNGQTPLMNAAARHNAATVKLLLELGASVHMLDERGDSPLMHALGRRTPDLEDVVRVLAKAGADPMIPNGGGVSGVDSLRRFGLARLLSEFEGHQEL